MNRLACWLSCMLIASGACAQDPALDPDVVGNADVAPAIGPKSSGPSVLRAQILLERAHFSPGEFDAAYGSNMREAIIGFQKASKLPATGTVDAKTWAALNVKDEAPLTHYKISDEDEAGPYQAVPKDMMQMSKLQALNYASMDEALGERFHIKPALLHRLNPDADFKAGEKITVPNVADIAPPEGAAKVIVDKSSSTVSLADGSGNIVAQFPASMGSRHDPLPLGNWKIKGVGNNPTFKYNPKLFWDADNKDSKAQIAAGPNNPVGVVWIDLSKPHYGIHGTPEPSAIGKTQSHGCIRMTNWSARIVADAVKPGMPAILRK